MKLIKEIKRKDGFVLFKRWRVLNLGFMTVDTHEFFLPPDSEDLTFDRDHFLHNHPRRLLSYIMDGGYTEEFKSDINSKTEVREIAKGKFNWVSLKCFHRIKKLHSRYVRTLIFTSNNLKDWGFLDDRNPDDLKIISNEEYRELKPTGYWDEVYTK
jgi:hypothetical protein